VAQAAERGVVIYPAHIHSHSGRDYRDTLLFGFGMLPEERIEEGFRILSSLLSGARAQQKEGRRHLPTKPTTVEEPNSRSRS
jgi:DNA-binding transcriptional MocR family regulator